MREITKQGEWACLYKTDDVDDCVRKMKIFLEDITDYQLQAKKNAGLVREMYSIDNHIENLFSLYRLVYRSHL